MGVWVVSWVGGWDVEVLECRSAWLDRMVLGRGRLCNLQYKPHALQFSSSFNPRLHKGVCVAPQFEHSALTGPLAPTLVPFPFIFPPPAVLRLLALRPAPDTPVAVALGPVEDRVECEDVLSVREGRPRVPALGPGLV